MRRKSRTFRSLASSRLTSKGQATIPATVRNRLDLKAGDTIMFEESAAGSVCLRKAEPL